MKKIYLITASAVLLCSCTKKQAPAVTPNNPLVSITTIAGDGFTTGNYIGGYGGDGGPATNAELNQPSGIAMDGNGNVYIADMTNNRIRMVNPSGTIVTVAGNGALGYSGDGAAATAAQLGNPAAVATDENGNLYISDTYNNLVRKVDASGTISTIAGNTTGVSSGGNAATAVQLHHPLGIAVDAGGNVYIAVWGDNQIRKVTPSGTISTVAGNGSNGYSGDGGAATAAQLFVPAGVAVDAGGNVYIADNGNNCIRKVTAAGMISTIAGNTTPGYSGDGSAAVAGELNKPTAVAADASGNIYIADNGNNCIRIVTSSGVISTMAGTGTAGYSSRSGPAKTGRLNEPFGVAVDHNGNVYIADTYNQRICKTSR